MAKNIFLHFLNKASSDLYGLSKMPADKHVGWFVEALNVAAFFCGEYCLMPPLFIAECSRARHALSRRIHYYTRGLFTLSMREASVDEYFEKKDDECGGQKEHHGDLFDVRTRNFVRKQKGSILTRDKVIGNELVTRREEGPDESVGFFRGIIDLLGMDARSVDLVRKIPARIRGDGGAVTWPAIRKILNERNRPPSLDKLQRVMQHYYFGEYLNLIANNLTVLTGLPFDRGLDFGQGRENYSHDWRVLQHALRIAGCWDAVRTLSAESMFELRATSGFFAFRDSVVEVGARSKSVEEAHRTLSVMTLTMDKVRDREKLQNLLKGHKNKATGVNLSREAIQALDQLLGVATTGLGEYGRKLFLVDKPASVAWTRRHNNVSTASVQTAHSERQEIPIAIFCALAEERDYLVKRWNMTGREHTHFWQAEVCGIHCVLYTADEMGRVPAAIATVQFLTQFNPKSLLVLGIAGGIKAENVSEGHLLIPAQVADMATRKIREQETDVRQEFRHHSYTVNHDIIRFLNSPGFKRGDWEDEAIDVGEWPNGLRPNLHISGPIASSDEVVSSTEWVKLLLKAWPQIKGVEMEAGGVCAAAEIFNNRVSVIRGVSDLADPLKADTKWRKIAMKTIATLVETLLAAKVIG